MTYVVNLNKLNAAIKQREDQMDILKISGKDGMISGMHMIRLVAEFNALNSLRGCLEKTK